MKLLPALLLAAAFTSHGALAQEAKDPFADALTARHGLMLLLASDTGKLGAMAKGEVAYDATAAAKSAANISALASVMSLDQFPEGSEYQKAEGSYALPAIWTAQDDFVAKITGLRDAAAKMETAAATDLASLQGGLKDLGAACGACHKAYRQSDN